MPTTTATLDRPAPAARPAPLLTIVLGAVLAVGTLYLLTQTGQLHGLAKAAGQNPKATGPFTSIITYLDNLQTAVIPIAIPAGTLGLIGGGVAYLVGSQRAQQLLMGVVVGLGLVLLAPELIA